MTTNDTVLLRSEYGPVEKWTVSDVQRLGGGGSLLKQPIYTLTRNGNELRLTEREIALNTP